MRALARSAFEKQQALAEYEAIKQEGLRIRLLRMQPGGAIEPKNPDYRKVAAATFDRQQAMRTLGISIARLEPREVDLAMPYSLDRTQKNGFVHAGIITAGLDNACGIAAFTLMPSGSDILTVEFKTNLLAPPRASDFRFAPAW